LATSQVSAATGANPNSSDERKANEREPIYALPFLGAAAVKEGASLPLPIGLSILGQYQREQIRAHGLQVGLGGGPLINADFVGFNGLTTRVRNLLFRGDFWVLPFLNVYGIAGSGWASTTTSLNRPITLITSTDSQGTTLGFGGTLAYGVEPYGFITLDANLTWSDQVILSVPARTVTVTPRVGHRWKSETVSDRAFSLWAGATLEEFENASQGSIPFGNTLPAGSGGITSFLPADFGAWHATLTHAQQEAVSQLLNELVMLEQNPNSAIARAQFSLNINPSKAWNFIAGGSMKMSKHWQLIAEAGFFGARTSVVGNVCYRFGI